MVRLVEVVLKPGSRVCPSFSSAGAESGGQLSPGYAGAEASGNFHYCMGREPKTDGHTIILLWRAQQASELSELWNALELRNGFLLGAWPDLHCCKGSQM